MVDEYQDTNASQFQPRSPTHLRSPWQLLRRSAMTTKAFTAGAAAEIANLLELEKYFPHGQSRQARAKLSLHHHYSDRRQRRHQKQQRPTAREATVVSKARARRFPCAHSPLRRSPRPNRQWSKSNLRGLSTQATWRDHAILFRTNQQARPLETASAARPACAIMLVGAQSYFSTAAKSSDFLAYLKMFVNPHDDVSLLRIANVPPRGLCDGTMERLLEEKPQARMLGLRRDAA